MKLTSAKRLEGHALNARDGLIGEMKDLYFDDHRWHIRYCVVETGQWLHSRRVLVAPEAVGAYDSMLKVFPVDLTTAQVRSSPDIDTDKPVSRQREEALRSYYGWSPYFIGDGLMVAPIFAPMLAANASEPGAMDDLLELKGDPHLRSINATVGYQIEALDGLIGHADDFLIDSTYWCIRYLIIDTKNWWPGRKVLVPPAWIGRVSWTKSEVTVGLTREAIKASPLYMPGVLSDPTYLAALEGYYDDLRSQKLQMEERPVTVAAAVRRRVTRKKDAARKHGVQRMG